MDIVFLDQASLTLDDIDFGALEALGSYRPYPDSTQQQAIDRAAEAQVIIVNKVSVTRELIGRLENLELVAVIATGYNNVDLQAAQDRDVKVCNVPGYAGRTVAQHTFALILNLATKVYKYHADVQAGKWSNASSFTLLSYKSFELAGKTIGIIGFGTIGREVAKIARAFGLNVLVYDIRPITYRRYTNTDLDTLLRQSDITTLHCPLTEQTANLIDKLAFEKIMPTAMLINAARGGLVDEQALADALNTDRLAAAGIDVLTEEPPASGNVLFAARNIIITPHSAWSSVQARQKLVDETARNIKAFMRNRPRNIVVPSA